MKYKILTCIIFLSVCCWYKSLSQDNIIIDLKKLSLKDSASFNNNFKITFKNGKKSVLRIITDKNSFDTLNADVVLDNYTVDFTFNKQTNGPEVINSKNKPYAIKDGSFKLLFMDTSVIIVHKAGKPQGATTTVGDKKEKIPYWTFIKANHLSFKLSDLALITDANPNCCDTCSSCDDEAFLGNNRIIYDARSGLTYFFPAVQQIGIDTKCMWYLIKTG
jgi:hypothetical protein